VWHVKEPSLLKAVSAKHRSKFADNGDSCQIAEKLPMQRKTNTQNMLNPFRGSKGDKMSKILSALTMPSMVKESTYHCILQYVQYEHKMQFTARIIVMDTFGRNNIKTCGS
jgi:hypothetical protein